LPIDEFNDYLIELADYFEATQKDSGPVDHRSFVEEEMRKLHG